MEKLTPDYLLAAYQKLPDLTLKEKTQIFYKDLRAKIDFIKNKDITLTIKDRELNFDKELLEIIDKATSPKKKHEALNHLFLTLLEILFIGKDKDQIAKGFDLFSKVVDINMPYSAIGPCLVFRPGGSAPIGPEFSGYPILFYSVLYGEIEIAKKLIDIGADINISVNGINLFQYLKTYSKDYPKELLDELTTYAAQKGKDFITPTQTINNFLERLPKDALAEICSYLSLQQLSNLASVNKLFASNELDHIMWKNLAQSYLPPAYQKLPDLILKEKIQIFYGDLKSKIELFLKGKDQIYTVLDDERSDAERSFDDEKLLKMLDEKISPQDKCNFISQESLIMLNRLIFKESLDQVEGIADRVSKDLDFLLKFVDINMPFASLLSYLPGGLARHFESRDGVDYPIIFYAVAYAVKNRNIEIAKKLIDAGADINISINGMTLFKYVKRWANDFKEPFSKELFDELTIYAAQKQSLDSYKA